MPATSVAQQKTAAIALQVKRGDIPLSKAGPAAKAMAKMSENSLEHYAKTKHGNLPEHVSKKNAV